MRVFRASVGVQAGDPALIETLKRILNPLNHHDVGRSFFPTPLAFRALERMF